MRPLHSALLLINQLISANKLSILIYHQVMPEFDLARPSEPDAVQFEKQIALISKYFKPISLSNAVTLLKQGKLPPRSVCITFDDGYLNNLTVAQPILHKYGVPATVFIATDYSDGTNMWNDRVIDLVFDQSLTTIRIENFDIKNVNLDSIEKRRELVNTLIKELKYLHPDKRTSLIDRIYQLNNLSEYPSKMMSPDQIRELAGKGIEIGAHTESHPILATLPVDQQRSEVLNSKETLENWLGFPVNGFAYPNGKFQTDWDNQSLALVQDSGFEYAVATDWGYSRPETNPYTLRRFTPWDKDLNRFHLRMVKNLL